MATWRHGILLFEVRYGTNLGWTGLGETAVQPIVNGLISRGVGVCDHHRGHQDMS